MEKEILVEFFQKKLSLIRWIESILKVPIDSDLCVSLAGGTILCYLAKTIDDDLIPTIHDSKNPYKQRENFSMFIVSCRELRVPLLKLVSFEDFAKHNIVQIVECLTSFAEQCYKQYVVAPLPSVTIADARAALEKEKNGDQLLKQLKTPKQILVGKVRVSAEVFRRTLKLLMSTNKSFNMDQFEETVAKAQAYFRRFSAKNTMNSLRKKAAFRLKVINEMVTTETDYVGYLYECIKKFKPLINKFVQEGVIAADSEHVIFNNIEEIADFNQGFLDKLKTSAQDIKANGSFLSVYKILEGALEVYKTYMISYSLSIQRVEQILCIDYVKQGLDEAKGNDKDMSSYLIMPVQRLPRYVLLLNELKKHTWEGHPDGKTLDEMMVLVKRVTTEINESKNKADAERKTPQLFEKYKRGKFLTTQDGDILYERDFTLKKTQVLGVLTPSNFVIVNNGIAKMVFPLQRIKLLLCNQHKDCFKIKAGIRTKVKLQGTVLSPDGGLIKMINEMKKKSFAQQSMLLDQKKDNTGETLDELTFDRNIDPEEELKKRRIAQGRMSICVRRPVVISDTSVSSDNIKKVEIRQPPEGKRYSQTMLPSLKEKDMLMSDRMSVSVRPRSRKTSTGSTGSFSNPKLVTLALGSQEKVTGSSSDLVINNQKSTGNNALTRAVLRGKNVEMVDGKRKKNSLGLDVYSFNELTAKPEGIEHDQLVFHMSDEDFLMLFEVGFEEFKGWKAWKQKAEEQKAGLW
ncbi:Rho/RAC guanine nucleotide exchange factor, putative [Entamoeba invadens IP1]|uniref:Rho/RAC guanine nucleotide exchange factor, putative n=1 Tax=Entamoeba invadens IP1 TaxID=370355 RepID=A0A0A1U871_ENTIV|nr:Rho/RAC guanine nucleotide exchange factor, putative [Entamoeba invadens IP1]ELP91031.1 Rho/RAC guanine nucleotide exchange factor, putative [Entamoeba invadens IP1]|eukprot:XP_004257802.1 Rho/RAC guanine nucleotide exchange factor, putative [Entamoeba invadens IP1]